MSASLVGSEMCIRDSLRPLHDRRGAGQVAGLPAALRPPRLARAPCHARPVSYTHLTLPTICSV
eukprot:12002075-Alexandrium_andersonii.AAC.1